MSSLFQAASGAAKTVWNGMENSISNILGKFKKDKKSKEELDKSTDVDEMMFEYSEYVSTKGILGLPPRFSALADMRMFSVSGSWKGSIDPEDVIGSRSVPSTGETTCTGGQKITLLSEPYEGTKWVDVYMKWGSLVYLEIGRPLFFSGLNKELIEAILSGNGTSDETLAGAINVEAAKTNVPNMITFKPAGVDYAYQVKILTDTLATFLSLDTAHQDFKNTASGNVDKNTSLAFADASKCSEYFGLPEAIGDVTEVPGSLRMIKSTEVANQSEKATKPLKLGRFDLTPLTNEIYSEVVSSTICLYTDGGVEIPFNMQHSTGASKLLSMITDNPLSGQTSELAFLTNDFNYQVDQGGDAGLLAKIENPWVKKILGSIPIGAKLIAPEVWQGVDVVKSASFKVILQAANPHKIAIFNEVLVPYMHLFAAFAPMNITSVSNKMMNRVGAYAPPFVVRMYSKGAVNMNLGLISSITVHKVPKELTIDGLPTRLEIELEVKDLYDVIGIPQNPRTRADVMNCTGLTEYLSSISGVAMSNEKLLLKYAETLSDVRTYAYSWPKRAANRLQQNINNAWNQQIASMTSISYGKINKI